MAVSGSLVRGLCTILQANFYEKALFVKPTWRLTRGHQAQRFLPFALCFYSHSRGAHTRWWLGA